MGVGFCSTFFFFFFFFSSLDSKVSKLFTIKEMPVAHDGQKHDGKLLVGMPKAGAIRTITHCSFSADYGLQCLCTVGY